MTPSLFSPEGLSGLVFLVFVAATLAGAVIATGTRQLIRSVAGLALCFLGVAGIYFYLGSPFLALMQLLIYVGAVCVTIVFAIMLAETAGPRAAKQSRLLLATLGGIASAFVVWAFISLASSTGWKAAVSKANAGTVADVGQALLTTYNFSFELISVVLLVAIVGSLALARTGRSK